MRLIKNWRQVLFHSWSMRAFAASMVCLWLPDVIFWVFGRDTSPRFWFVLAFLLLVAGMVLRLKDQDIGDE